MDSVQINLKTPTGGLVKLDVQDIVEKNGELQIKLRDRSCYIINENDTILFLRKINYENDSLTFTEGVIVKEEDSDHILHTTIPNKRVFDLPDNFYEFRYNEEEGYHIITVKDNSFLFGQDLAVNEPQVLYFKDYDDNILGTCTGIKALQKYRMDELTKEDCLEYEENVETCGKSYDYVTYKYYRFLPECASRHTFMLTDFNEIEMGEAKYIETKFNPYYYYTINTSDLDDYGNPVRHCHFYGDKWFNSFHDSTTVKYVNLGKNENDLYFDEDCYSLCLGLSNDANESNLGCEDYFSEQFAKDIEESLIPDFIDMERVKYVPYGVRYNKPLTSITIYNHFRQRVVLDLENNTNTLATSGNMYYDGWYIDVDNNYDVYWNGYHGDGSFSSIQEFINASGKTSDLIGFLNFTDNDIYYRKHKLSKSFFRISFYDSNDPIEQKLLYYSTVFVDSTGLFCKFLKQSGFIQDSDPENVVINEINLDENGVKNENVKVVFCENKNVGCRLDSTILLTNEYDRSRSSEGFNLYLFADDAPEGNEEKTIYMKVEFNHAGNGKTIPMIVMPTDEKLTMSNFMDHLFMPITIRKRNGVYTYKILDAYDHSDGNADLCLFEPKLELEDEG